MDEFAIDLDKVLDDFEKSEDSTTNPGKCRQTESTSNLTFNTRDYSSGPSRQVNRREPDLYSFQSVNNHYNGNLTSYSLNHQQLDRLNDSIEKIDLSEADFSASTSSFTKVTGASREGNLVDHHTPEEGQSAYRSLYSSFGLEKLSNTLHKAATVDECRETVKTLSSIANGYGEEEEVLAVHLTPEQSKIEIKLIPSNSAIVNVQSVVSKGDNSEDDSFSKTEHLPSETFSSPAKESYPEFPTLIFSPGEVTTSKTVNSETGDGDIESKNDGLVTLPWESLAAELQMEDIMPNDTTTATNTTAPASSDIVSFNDLESIDVNADELESYLKDLEDINFINAVLDVSETQKAKVETDSLVSESVETVKSTQSPETQVVGGARPKIKDCSDHLSKPTTVETVERDEAICVKSNQNEQCDNVQSESKDGDKINNSNQTRVETEIIHDSNEATPPVDEVVCESEASPTHEKDDSKEDATSLSEDVEEESCEKGSTEDNSDASNSKVIRPTSLNLPSPLLASGQPQLVPPIVEQAPVITDASPSPELSETDSALPPSPEVSQAENGENNVGNDAEDVTSVKSPTMGDVLEPDANKPDTDEPEVNDVESNVEMAAEYEYASELTEEEQLLGKIKPFWIPDEDAPNCLRCDIKFTVLKRRHHCRGCGQVFCSQCSNSTARIPYLKKEARVCSLCLDILNKVAAVEKRLFSKSSTEERDRVPVEVIPRSESPSPNHSPSLHSTDERETSGPSGWNPNPNNPQDYCSQVSPLQQAQAYFSRPPPSVMVPVGVLKRGDKPKREPKQVMFSDGIRPGGDLTELDLAISPEPKISSRKTGSSGRPQRRVLEKGSPVGQLRSPQHPQSPLRVSSPIGPSTSSRRLKSRGSGRLVIYDEEGPLPPIILPLSSIELTENDEKLDSTKLLDCLQDESTRPVIFALTKNLYISIKLVKLDCCLQKQCWVFASRGLNSVGQDEVMVVLERLPNENTIPRDIFLLFTSLQDSASMGSPVSELGHLLFPEGLLGSRDHGAFLFIQPTYQCLSKLHFPQAPYLVAVLLQKWEVPWAKVFPLRLMLRIGSEYRYYPCPLVSVRFRKPVYGEIGHTIMSVLADFRNYQYTLPTIPGVVVCMEDKKTTVSLPRNRYAQVCRVVASSNEHVLSFGAAFSIDADSHLVCVQDDDGNYQTQAINIQNTTRKVTGASFIVFSGALKSTTGLTAKSSIVEDGLLVQITPEAMTALKNSFQQMKDFVIDCKQVDAVDPDEQVILKWTDDDRNFNIGVKSVIDGKNLEGIQSIRIHNGTDYTSDRYLIRWTEVFFLSNETINQRGEPADPSKLADGVAQAFCLGLVSHLPLLVEADLSKIGLRVTLDSEQVGYEVGSKEEPLPAIYMVDLDTSLIPVITNASSGTLDSGSLTLELVFHILRK